MKIICIQFKAFPFLFYIKHSFRYIEKLHMHSVGWSILPRTILPHNTCSQRSHSHSRPHPHFWAHSHFCSHGHCCAEVSCYAFFQIKPDAHYASLLNIFVWHLFTPRVLSLIQIRIYIMIDNYANNRIIYYVNKDIFKNTMIYI